MWKVWHGNLYGASIALNRLRWSPLHILQQNLLTVAVIELRGPAIGVASDALGSFKGAVIFQKVRDTGCAEGVRRIVGG
jgi:hypothetical protein